MRILLVDDSRAMRSILRRMVEQLGFDVTEACNGREALELIEAGKTFDGALLDWNMPEMSGIDLLETLRTKSELDSMRIMMVTSEADIQCMERALTAGADEYVIKPFDRSMLVEKLTSLGFSINAISSDGGA